MTPHTRQGAWHRLRAHLMWAHGKDVDSWERQELTDLTAAHLEEHGDINDLSGPPSASVSAASESVESTLTCSYAGCSNPPTTSEVGGCGCTFYFCDQHEGHHDASVREKGEFVTFGAVVRDAGGGIVDLLVDRDAYEYPPRGAHVRVTAWDSATDEHAASLLSALRQIVRITTDPEAKFVANKALSHVKASSESVRSVAAAHGMDAPVRDNEDLPLPRSDDERETPR